jgi:hypothetical protein
MKNNNHNIFVYISTYTTLFKGFGQAIELARKGSI